MQSRYLFLTATTILTIAGTTTSVSAKTRSTGVKINTVKPSAKMVIGKTTPGAKVSVTRYKITYATGKANKTGVFKLKLKHAVTASWHYRITATKPGYKTTVKHFGVKAVPVKVTPTLIAPVVSTTSNVNVDELKAQIANLQDKLTSANNASTAQINSLNSKLSDLQSQLAQNKNTIKEISDFTGLTNSNESNKFNGLSEAEYNADWERMEAISKELDEKRELLSAWNTDVDYLPDEIAREKSEIETKKQALTDDPNNQTLQYELSKLQERYDSDTKQLNKTLHAKEVIGNNIMNLKNSIDALEKEYWALYEAVGA